MRPLILNLILAVYVCAGLYLLFLYPEIQDSLASIEYYDLTPLAWFPLVLGSLLLILGLLSIFSVRIGYYLFQLSFNIFIN